MWFAIKNWWNKAETEVDDLAEGKAAPSLPLPSDTTKSIRIGVLLLVFGVGGFGFWAVTAPLDEGVPTQGTVSIESKRKTVQHLSGGIVKELLVTEATYVKEGQPLVILDGTQIKANYDSALQTFYALKAAEGRLEAEQAGRGDIRFAAELTQEPVHPQARLHMDTQRQLLQARRNSLNSELAVFNENAATYEGQAKGLEEQLGFMKQELVGQRELAAEGYASRKSQFELERQYSDLQTNMTRARRGVSEMKLRAIQRQQDYRKEVETQLADVRRDAANAAERARSLKEDLDRIQIRSPADGFVTGLAIHTVGGVVTPGQKMMDIVPGEGALIVESHVASHLIDRVHAGLEADINLHAFAHDPQMILQGKVISISADLITDPNPQVPPYYLARVEVTPDGLQKLGKHQLQPGMPADVVIKTGERTLLTYIMKPLVRRLASAMTEN